MRMNLLEREIIGYMEQAVMVINQATSLKAAQIQTRPDSLDMG